jgi:hypothetical protein
MKDSVIFGSIKAILIPAIAIVSFAHFMVEMFGQIIPNIIWSFFKEVGFVIVLVATLIFAIMWFWHSIPHGRPKNYTIIRYDVFGQEAPVDGLRTEFEIHDVAWSFMKQYKKLFPIHNFALVSNIPNSEKKAIHRYV